MTKETDLLFLNTLKDIERRIELEDPYDILGCSALLRKLLIDEYPLVHQVNRERRLKLRFQIGLPLRFPPGLEPTAWSIQDGLDPATSVPGHATTTVDLDGFLAAKVLASEGKTYTVKDLVQFEANIMGGVHAGTPREQKEHVLDSLGRLFEMGGYRVSLRQLKAICRVALRGLAELRQDVDSTSPGNQGPSAA